MSNEQSLGTALVIAPFLLLLFLEAQAVSPNPASPCVEIPGGIADPSGEIGYVENPSKGIDAINLRSGELLWKTQQAAKPLLVSRSSLIALGPSASKRNQIAVVVLDLTKKGAMRLQSEPIRFPDWVQVEPVPGKSFAVEVRLEEKHLLLRWEAHARYAGGAPPSPEVQKRARKDASEVVRVDLENGHVKVLPESDFSRSNEQIPEKLAAITSQPYWVKGGWSTVPFLAGDYVAALATEKNQGVEKCLLRRWDLKTGKPIPPIILAEGSDVVPRVTLDGRHLFLRKEGKDEETKPSAWLVSLKTGDRVGTLNVKESVQEISAIDPRVYYAVAQGGTPTKPGQPTIRLLKAADLKSGEVQWQHRIIGLPASVPRP